MTRNRNVKYYLAASIALLTFAVYLPALQNDFVGWDDNPYIVNNIHIRSFDTALFKWAFFDFYASNWHPLTWLSHALDFAVWGLNPLGHHLTNIILHAINSFIVVFLTIRLLEAFKDTTIRNYGPSSFPDERTMLITGGVTGLLFGLHPLHVESVAWVAERKDLLCALFFMLSIISYAKYAGSRGSGVRGQKSGFRDQGSGVTLHSREHSLTLGAGRSQKLGVRSQEPEDSGNAKSETKKTFTNKRYLSALGFFVLALLSKPMAITLPVVLLILDWHPFDRISSIKTARSALVEKLPFIALGLVSAIVTIAAQRSLGAMELTELVPLQDRVLVAAGSLVAYLGKMLWPRDLVPLYPYPSLNEVSLFSPVYLSAIIFIIGLTLAFVVIAKKRKLWFAAWGYYVVTLVPVIGIIQVGSQSMADRYMYLPSLGPFMVIGLAAAWVWGKVNVLQSRVFLKALSIVLAVFVFAVLSYLTVMQIGIWKNSTIFWDYIIEKKPYKNPVAYNNRAILYAQQGLFDKAIEDFDIAIALNANSARPYYNRGLAYAQSNQDNMALRDFNKALMLNENLAGAYFDRGWLFMRSNQKGPALTDFQKACILGYDKGCGALQSITP